MTELKPVTPEAFAREMGWAPKRVRRLAKKLGACCVLGNRMALLPHHIDQIIKATEPCPSKSIDVKEAMSGNTVGRLPDIDSVDLLAHLTRKPRKELRPRSKTSSGNVVSMEKKRL